MQLKLLPVSREAGREICRGTNEILFECDVRRSNNRSHSWSELPRVSPGQGQGRVAITASDDVRISSPQSSLPWQQNAFILR